MRARQRVVPVAHVGFLPAAWATVSSANGAIVERADLRLSNVSWPCHSGVIPASLTIGPHFSVSDTSSAASSAGVEVVTGAPIASYLSLTDGCPNAAIASE